MTATQIAPIFTKLQKGLKPLLEKIQNSPNQPDTSILHQNRSSRNPTKNRHRTRRNPRIRHHLTKRSRKNRRNRTPLHHRILRRRQNNHPLLPKRLRKLHLQRPPRNRTRTLRPKPKPRMEIPTNRKPLQHGHPRIPIPIHRKHHRTLQRILDQPPAQTQTTRPTTKKPPTRPLHPRHKQS